MMQLYHGIAAMLFRYHGYGWRQRTILVLRDVTCSRDFAPVTSPYIHIKSKPKTLSCQNPQEATILRCVKSENNADLSTKLYNFIDTAPLLNISYYFHNIYSILLYES
jgi:hypothetical protein